MLGQSIHGDAVRERSGHEGAQRVDSDGACGPFGRDRRAAGPDGVFEVRLPTGVDAGGLSGLRNREGCGAIRADSLTSGAVIRIDGGGRSNVVHSKLEAIRCLKRYIAREVFSLLKARIK